MKGKRHHIKANISSLGRGEVLDAAISFPFSYACLFFFCQELELGRHSDWIAHSPLACCSSCCCCHLYLGPLLCQSVRLRKRTDNGRCSKTRCTDFFCVCWSAVSMPYMSPFGFYSWRSFYYDYYSFNFHTKANPPAAPPIRFSVASILNRNLSSLLLVHVHVWSWKRCCWWDPILGLSFLNPSISLSFYV